MFCHLIYQLNPFNIYGRKIEVNDLIDHPLQPDETLMEDYAGCCRRVHVADDHATVWEKIIFWLQSHVNKKSHLEAIDKLIFAFYQKLLRSPPKEIKELQEFNLQIDQLFALKNDYGFVNLKNGDSAFIDLRLKEIKQHAYSIFTYHHKKQVLSSEKQRKIAFISFQERIKKELQSLALEHTCGLIKARFLIISPPKILRFFFEERVKSLDSRLKTIKKLCKQVTEIEKEYEGKFTIPFIESELDRMRNQLYNEVGKIQIELEFLISILVFNYYLIPFKRELKLFLDSIQIDPNLCREGKSASCVFQKALEDEIKHLKSFFPEK